MLLACVIYGYIMETVKKEGWLLMLLVEPDCYSDGTAFDWREG
jgi:hypothetical protein